MTHRFSAALALALVAGCAGDAPPDLLDGGPSCLQPVGCEGPETPCCDKQNLCATTRCQGMLWVCAQGKTSSVSWVQAADATCDDGDPCTVGDFCVSEACVGTAKPCDTPPRAECADVTTVRTFSAQGTCDQGQCNYTPKETVCPSGCADGKCIGEPCLGVTCDSPPSPCYKSPGTCIAGECNYTELPSGAPCLDKDPCAEAGTCDGEGNCSGVPMDCSAPHASGTCINGACQYTCDTDHGNCDTEWSNGCETSLTTSSHCGDCDTKCTAKSHATASCSSGTCKLSCIAPYKDCDKDISNGCEIPVGVANRCDKSGLNSQNGCGTAYCGSSSAQYAINFGSWTCTFCAHCHQFSDGQSWCLYKDTVSLGQFSPQRCTSCCASSEQDHVCPK